MGRGGRELSGNPLLAQSHRMATVFDQPFNVPSTVTMLAVTHLVLVVTICGMSLRLVLIRISGASTALDYYLLNLFFGVLLPSTCGAIAHGGFHGRSDDVFRLLLTTQTSGRLRMN